MNDTIDVLMAHKSIRKFTNEPISSELLKVIIRAGQAAPSSSFLQAVSIIRVTDMELRNKLAIVTSLSVGTFLIGRCNTSLKLSARLKIKLSNTSNAFPVW